MFLPGIDGNFAERLLRDRGRTRALVAAYAHSQLCKTYHRFLADRWEPPTPLHQARACVSLTSWPPRFNDLPLVLLTLIQQTARPQEIILWLTESDQKLLDPQVERRFTPYGVRVSICDNLKSHKKWLPMIESGHAKPFVICDDDIVYPRTWLARLLAEERSDAFVGLRAHRITLDKNGKIKPYTAWKKQMTAVFQPSPLTFVTGGAGAIIDPQRIPSRFLDRAEILSKCPTADDVWLNAIHNGSGI